MPHAVDIHIGARLRALRIRHGMTQTSLADEISLSFQQIQKYETGYNRISASKLFELSQILEVDPAYFFEGTTGRSRIDDDTPSLKFVRAAQMIEGIPDKQVRDSFYGLLKSLTAKKPAARRSKKRTRKMQ